MSLRGTLNVRGERQQKFRGRRIFRPRFVLHRTRSAPSRENLSPKVNALSHAALLPLRFIWNLTIPGLSLLKVLTSEEGRDCQNPKNVFAHFICFDPSFALTLTLFGLFTEALMALKRKALYTGQIEKLNGARLKLDEQIIAIEAASTNLIVLDAMSEGAQTMKSINRQMYVHSILFYSFQSEMT